VLDESFVLFLIEHSDPDEAVLDSLLHYPAVTLALIQAVYAGVEKQQDLPIDMSESVREAVKRWVKGKVTWEEQRNEFTPQRLEILRWIAERSEHGAFLTALLQQQYLKLLVMISQLIAHEPVDTALAATADVPLLVAAVKADMLTGRWEGHDANFAIRTGWLVRTMLYMAEHGHAKEALELLDALQAWNPSFSPDAVVHQLLRFNETRLAPVLEAILANYAIDVGHPAWIQWRALTGSTAIRAVMIAYEQRLAREAAERRRAPEAGRGAGEEEEEEEGEPEDAPKARRLRSVIKASVHSGAQTKHSPGLAVRIGK